jgi:hypothetical protein
VKQINSSPKYLYSVCSVVVFGSFPEPNWTFGGRRRRDRAFVATRRNTVMPPIIRRLSNPNKRADAHLRYATESGRQFGNFTDQLYWAEAEVLSGAESSPADYQHSTVAFVHWD